MIGLMMAHVCLWKEGARKGDRRAERQNLVIQGESFVEGRGQPEKEEDLKQEAGPVET